VNNPDDYRRRKVPVYDVFAESLPVKVPGLEYQYHMRRGVMIVEPKGARGGLGGEIPAVPVPVAPASPSSDRAVGSDASNSNDKGVDISFPIRAGMNTKAGGSGATLLSPIDVEFAPDALPENEITDVEVKSATLTNMHAITSVPPAPPVHATVESPPSPGTARYMREIAKNSRSHLPTSSLEPFSMFSVLSFDDFLLDFKTLRNCVHAGPVTSYTFKRLEILMAKFHLHNLLNSTRELDAQKSVPHRDFYNIRKVDTHVHHSACMSQKHLLRFIKHKLRYNPTEHVIIKDGRTLTLGEVFVSLNLTAYDLSIDTLDMHAHDTMHRFDRFNLKYNPAGQSRLREIFLKTDNYLQGRYLAEITKEVMGDLTASKYQLVEWRVSIYGRKRDEWTKLANWFYNNRLAHPNVRWLIQIPRLYYNYRKAKEVSSFQELLENIFMPLFEVTNDPESNPALHYFLETIVGIDSVDDESRPEHKSLAGGPGGVPTPDNWTFLENPPFGYWMYFTYANLCVLNQMRASKGLCTFKFRPHCGEAGDMDNLISAYLLADQINHGILLRKNAGLQYLYYLSQVGIAMSPLSNNKLFLDYHKNPFPHYFSKGLNVSLSTDDPLMLHYTKDPLLEEFSVAAQVWKLGATDQAELARNSVLQSGWDARYKRHFLGEKYADIRETNVPVIRLAYRQETLSTELEALGKYASYSPPPEE